MGGSPDPRLRALRAAAEAPRSPAEAPVEFQSAGRLLILGEGEAALIALQRLDAALECHWLSAGSEGLPPRAQRHDPRGRRPRVEGRLGRFRILLEGPGGSLDLGAGIDPARPHFDLVLDLGETPAVEREWGPPGYHRPRDAAGLEAALTRLAESVGRVEKPRYFGFDSSICAHGPPGTEGCRRCIDACPAEAIASVEGRIRVDAELCQGGGGCATSCPTGAMSYRLPAREDTVEALRRLLRAYREAAGGERPVLVLCDGSAGADGLADWPERALPWTLPELASVGLECWLAAFASGAAAVRLLRPPWIAPRLRRVLDEQLSFGRAILAGLGQAEGALSWLGPDGDALEGPELSPVPVAEALPAGTKREALVASLEHLLRHSTGMPELVPLPPGAPFGRLRVDEGACTTCFACVFACPTRALAQGGGELPQLRFAEAACVQCGLCRATCPEDAIELEARLLVDGAERRRQVLLHEDEPFACLRCGRPFASAATIRAVTERLAGHAMFADDGIDILKCCDDCKLRQL